MLYMMRNTAILQSSVNNVQHLFSSNTKKDARDVQKIFVRFIISPINALTNPKINKAMTIKLKKKYMFSKK